MSLGTTIVVLLVTGWVLQLALAQRQARIFLRSVGELRATGTTAVGVGGKGWARPRTYVALSAGPDGRVRQARRLRGVTVWARPVEVPELRGRPLAELAESPAGDGTAQATAMAARTLLEAGRGAGAANP
jgi:DNA-binding transcriptional regulator of glucitol operon